MPNNINTYDLINTLQSHIELQWLAGKNSENNTPSDTRWDNHPKLVGHMNLIHPSRVQVLGHTEVDYLNSLSKHNLDHALSTLHSSKTALVIVANVDAPDYLLEHANQTHTPLLHTSLSSYETVNRLRLELGKLFADNTLLHGVFMEVISVGVLITGDAAMGKSELALELISRGHRLVADDATKFTQLSPDIVEGSSPPMLQDLLEVRGLGVLNIREMYGDGSLKQSKYLRLIIHLVDQHKDLERLDTNNSTQTVLGKTVPVITLHVAPGRNLAVMVEAAVRNYKLMEQGYNSNDDLINRHTETLHNKTHT